MRAELDATDWRILKELQADGRITNVALAARVGLSPPPCLRRVKALEEAGLIRGYHAELDEPRVGFEVTAFAAVRLHAQGEPDLREFEKQILMWPLVRDLLKGSALVSLAETAAAVRMLAERHHVIAEGAGAAPVAAALAGDHPGPVVCIVSGGHLDAAHLAIILAGGVP